MLIDGLRTDLRVPAGGKTSSWEVQSGPPFGGLFDNPHAFDAWAGAALVPP